MKKINPSNTSLSTYKQNRHRKFDIKQAKRHNFGKANCVVCDEVFTKYHWATKTCSKECSIENRKALQRKYQKNNSEKINARRREHRTENHERLLSREHKYNKENSEKINARRRARHKANPEKRNEKNRKRYADKKMEE